MVGLARFGVPAILLAAACACGSGDGTLDAGSATTALDGMAPLCAPYEYGPPVTAVAGAGGNGSSPYEREMLVRQVLDNYGREHPDAWAGQWSGSTSGTGGGITVGIVGDVDTHRAAILARRAQPADIEMYQSEPTATDDTTVGESTVEITVVPMRATLQQLEALRAQISEDARQSATGWELSAITIDYPTGLVRLGVVGASDETRQLLAERYDATMLCVDQLDRIRSEIETTDTTLGAAVRD